jgi:beta-glucosidase-like glycosyl hydrolase
MTGKPVLERTDLVPFASAIRAGVGSVMSAFVAYPRWDPSGRAAGFSPVMLDHLRDTLAFRGLVVTDALIMAGATARQAEAPATASAVAAGCDVLLYPEDFAGVVAALDRAVGGVIPVARADAALARYQEAIDVWGQGPDQGDPDVAAHAAYADWLASRVTHMVRGDVLPLRPPFTVAIVDDDVGGPYTVGPRDVFTRTLREASVPVAMGKGEEGRGKGIVLVYAEPRSWKGRADLGVRSLRALRRMAPQAALVVLFAHPRLTIQIPGNAPVLCCWHGQPLMQRAAARWVIEKTR